MQKQDRISYSNVYNIWLTVFKSYKPCSAKGKSHTAQGMKEKKVHNWGNGIYSTKMAIKSEVILDVI